jgi:hypothetical protein
VGIRNRLLAAADPGVGSDDLGRPVFCMVSRIFANVVLQASQRRIFRKNAKVGQSDRIYRISQA